MAEKLEQYIKEEQDGAIDLVLGESMGGATAGMLFHRQKVKAIPHNSKCRYDERGAADAKPKAQIILDCLIEHFDNADAVPQLPEWCLSRKAGIVRCCLSFFNGTRLFRG